MSLLNPRLPWDALAMFLGPSSLQASPPPSTASSRASSRRLKGPSTGSSTKPFTRPHNYSALMHQVMCAGWKYLSGTQRVGKGSLIESICTREQWYISTYIMPKVHGRDRHCEYCNPVGRIRTKQKIRVKGVSQYEAPHYPNSCGGEGNVAGEHYLGIFSRACARTRFL